MPTIRDEWINRPAHLMHLSLAEYIAGKENKVTPVPPTFQLKASGGRSTAPFSVRLVLRLASGSS